MDWRILATMTGLIGGTYLAIIALQRWISGHIANRSKHPCTDEIVYKDVCEQVQITSAKEHKYLSDCIERIEKQTGEKFDDLKKDMKDGFEEIKNLIRD